jgi:glycosyltransferase involved in cell wall biosynthesis
VVASEHEGFCVPLVEALAFGVPVLAYAAGAIPEVLGGAGVLLQEKSPLAMAAAVQEIVTDSARKASLREAGSTRLEEIGTDMAAMRLASMLVRLGESPGESRGRSSGERPGESVSS